MIFSPLLWASLISFLKAVQISVRGIYAVVIGNIISIIPEGRRIEGQQPNGCYPKIFQIIQFLQKAFKITYSISITVKKGFDMQFINYCIFIPVFLIVLIE